MNQRERLLSLVVGVMLATMALVFAYGRIDNLFARRRATLSRIQNDVDGKRQIIMRGKHVLRRLTEFEARSLPANQALAGSQYQAWLSEIVQQAGIEGIQVKPVAQAQRANGSTQLTFSVSGKGDLRQVVAFLESFYKLDAIHRIRRLPLKPIEGTKLLQATNIMIDTLVVPTADERKDFDTSAASEFAENLSEDFAAPILARNMFSPENRAPSFSEPKPQKVEIGDSLAVEISAKDADKLDKVVYRLDESAPAGAEIDEQSGRVKWKPKELGKFSFSVIAEDDGIPRLSSTVKVTVEVVAKAEKVVEKPKVEAKFDDARFTYPIAVTKINGEPQVWLQIRTSGEVLRLKNGDEVSIGSVQGVISHIGQRTAEIETEDKTLKVSFGKPLVESSDT